MWNDRVPVQAICRRLPTAAAMVRSRVRSSGICGRSRNETGSLWVLGFPMPILVHRLFHSQHKRAKWPSGLSLDSPRETAIRLCGVCGGQGGTEQDSEYIGLPDPNTVHVCPMLSSVIQSSHSRSICGCCTKRRSHPTPTTDT
jgi:hypothetical protein